MRHQAQTPLPHVCVHNFSDVYSYCELMLICLYNTNESIVIIRLLSLDMVVVRSCLRELAARNLFKAKFHYASWFGACSELV